MMTYTIAKHSAATAELAQLLQACGAQQETSTILADVVLLAVDSVQDLATALEDLGVAAARKTIVVGLSQSISCTQLPYPGTLEGTLDEYRPLGVLVWVDGDLGFLGDKELSEKIGLGFLKAFSSRYYGSWMIPAGQNVAEFVVRLATAEASP